MSVNTGPGANTKPHIENTLATSVNLFQYLIVTSKAQIQTPRVARSNNRKIGIVKPNNLISSSFKP